MNMSELKITPFRKEYQSETRALILQGLGERWGWINEDINEDLKDIASFYRDGLFVLAWIDNNLVGTGALMPEDKGVMRVVRMSVLDSYRRQGIGNQILDYLISQACSMGCHLIVVETTSTWTDAIAFYEDYGFNLVEDRDGSTHFILNLQSNQ